ncbi:MAG: beta-xylosidase, partial [Acidobacteriota bacterium]|nr:beta-xylosidase [Acidobacteriota bacterium]
MLRCLPLFLSLSALLAQAQLPVTIRVNAAEQSNRFEPVWSYFGHDEPNYTYSQNGIKLIRELAALSYTPVHIRTHFLLASGDGTPALKWGSTNIYTEDAAGKPIYNWKIVDKIIGAYVSAGATPFVEIGFMPKALSTHPDPYTPVWKPHGRSSDYNLGWTYPPNNYDRWSDLIYQWVTHCLAKYGRAEVETWDWEVWNEPDIGYWHGTPEEYDKLYDYTAAAVKRALPSAHVGGPASTGPAGAKAAAFLKQFLEHCSSGKNAATGKVGVPLDFISFHAKGRPELAGNYVRMGISQELKDASDGFEIIRSFPKLQNLPVVLSEADPEGCAACSARVYPPNAYRNGALYPSYTAAAIKAITQIAARDRVNLKGILTWAFEFEDQPYFDGFRTLATNGIDKPILNVFRMAGLMRGDLLNVESSGAVSANTMVNT